MINNILSSKEFKKDSETHRKTDFYKYVCDAVKIDGLWLEFGTGAGNTTRELCEYVSDKLYTFDWFGGLPEDWIYDPNDNVAGVIKAGSFGIRNINKLSKFLGWLTKATNNKAIILVGLFKDTLPDFLATMSEKVAFIHIDCDIYSSTSTVLTLLKDRILPGTVILFDEFYNYPNWREHEARAFLEFISETGYSYGFIAHVKDRYQVAIIIGE